MSGTSKKVWSKPECIRIKLVPGEAMIAGCKTNTSTVLSGQYSFQPCVPGGPPCMGVGS